MRAHNAPAGVRGAGRRRPSRPTSNPAAPPAPTVQFADGALVVTWSPPANEGSAITDYDVQIGGGVGRVQRVGTATTFRWDGPDERPGVHVPGARRERQGRGPVQLAVGARAPAAPPRRPGRTGRRARRQDDQRVAGRRPATAATRSSSTRCRSLSTGRRPNRPAPPRRSLGQPAQRPAPAVPVRARNRAGWGPVGGVGRRRPVRRARRSRRASGRATRRRRRHRLVGGAGRPGLRDHRLHGPRQRRAATQRRRRPDVGDVRRPAATARSYTFTVVARNEVGDGARSAASNAVIPAGPPCAPPITGADPRTPAASTSRWTAANANGSADHAPTSCRSTAAAGRTSAPARRTRRTGARQRHDVHVPGARRQRRRRRGAEQHPRAHDAGRAGPGRRRSTSRRRDADEIAASWSAPNDNGKPITQLRGRPEPRAVVERDQPLEHDVDRRSQDDTRYTVRVRACNRSAAGRGAGRSRRRTTPPPPRSVTWSSYGSAQGQPELQHARSCAFVRVRRGTGLTPGSTYTVTCHGAVQGAFSATDRTADGSGVVVDDHACYFGYNESFWMTIGGVESDHRQRPAIEPATRGDRPAETGRRSLHEPSDRPASRVVQPLVQRPARQRRAGHQGQARPDRPRPSCACSARATCCSTTCPAPARRRWPRRSPTRSRARGAGSSSRPTCCRPTSPAASSTTSRRARSTSGPAPVFSNVVLADEINRASPKTQAALLEVMEERHVTVDGIGYDVPRPFVVIATQNPVEQEGTYRLPEAQLDRFLHAHDARLPRPRPRGRRAADARRRPAPGGPVAGDVDRRRAHDDRRSPRRSTSRTPIRSYVVRLCAATRTLPQLRLGVSTRGAIALVRTARALAAAQARPFVTPDDVRIVAPAVMGHRMLLTPEAELGKVDAPTTSSTGPRPRRAPAPARAADDETRSTRPLGGSARSTGERWPSRPRRRRLRRRVAARVGRADGRRRRLPDRAARRPAVRRSAGSPSTSSGRSSPSGSRSATAPSP